MVTANNPIIVIPVRMGSTRLPGKPLANIAGEPMVLHVWRRAIESGCGPVIVACAEKIIEEAVIRAGGKAVMTDPNHISGSDRINEALEQFDPAGQHKVVINLQGDLPTINPNDVRALLAPIENSSIDIATLVSPIVDPKEYDNPNVVKAAVSITAGASFGPAIYFSRAAVPWSQADNTILYHHIGVYAYRRETLRRFVAAPPGELEQIEKLEQLRALENGMRISAVHVDTVPLGVDTPADLERVRQILTLP